jgi:hypothetical protein
MPVTAEAIARYEQASPLLLAMEKARAPPVRLDTKREAAEWNRARTHYEAPAADAAVVAVSFLQHWC